ncbi:uncharacterized protein LOC114577681 isoform X9 [Apis cerana]|uniref:uncharacterized protein LOC114577681 isoform X9 n=1 Tax=Apis cerana TaxID=7461 RepID=UPI002B23E1E6|nr:uncharacterized protein LOC114577681 isoform X9 [Apis cerana]
MLLCTKFPVTSNGGISEARGATNRVDHWRLEGDSSVSPAPKQRCDETTLLAKEIREWRCGTGSRARRNVRVSERGRARAEIPDCHENSRLENVSDAPITCSNAWARA